MFRGGCCGFIHSRDKPIDGVPLAWPRGKDKGERQLSPTVTRMRRLLAASGFYYWAPQKVAPLMIFANFLTKPLTISKRL